MKKKEAEHPPAFQLYANDFSSSATVEAMSTMAVGAYMLLLCKAWHQEPVGSIPENDDVLSKWARVSRREWDKIRESVLAAFVLIDGRWHQRRMQAEWAKLLERRKERRLSGTNGAKKRWQTDSEQIAEPSRSNSKRKQNAVADDDSSVSSSTSSSSSVTEGNTVTDGPGPSEPGEAAEEPVLIFPVIGKPFQWPLVPSKIREFQETFPALDILGQCKLALQWCKENRSKQKTAGGMGRFLLSWLSRAQNDGRGSGPGSGTGGQKVNPTNDPRGNFAAREAYLQRRGAEHEGE